MEANSKFKLMIWLMAHFEVSLNSFYQMKSHPGDFASMLMTISDW